MMIWRRKGMPLKPPLVACTSGQEMQHCSVASWFSNKYYLHAAQTQHNVYLAHSSVAAVAS